VRQGGCSHPAAVAAKLARLEVDHLVTTSSASNKSWSLELLLLLHRWSSAMSRRAQTNAAGQLERVARYCSRRDAGNLARHGRAGVKVAVAGAAGARLQRCRWWRAPRSGLFHNRPSACKSD